MDVPRARSARFPRGPKGPHGGPGAPSGPQGPPWGQGAAERTLFYFKPCKENALFEHQIFLVAWEKNRTLWRLGHPRAENANPSTHEDEKCEPFGAQEPKM